MDSRGVWPQGDETLDLLRDFDLRLLQKKSGYRFSLDPLLLCRFCEAPPRGRVADLGTGCGVIPLVLARRFPEASFLGVEVQEEMARLAERNVALNGLDSRVTVVTADILKLSELLPASSFDAVVANPPFRPAGTGRVSPRTGRDVARHETTAGLADFLAEAKRLAVVGGKICLIYHVSRLQDLLVAARGLKLFPQRLRFVHEGPSAVARMFLVELVKGRKGELMVLPPFFVGQESGRDTG